MDVIARWVVVVVVVLATRVGLMLSSLKLVQNFPADDKNHQEGLPVSDVRSLVLTLTLAKVQKRANKTVSASVNDHILID